MAAVWTFKGRHEHLCLLCHAEAADFAHLDDFCHTVDELALAERLEEGCINEDVFGLTESADEVLAQRHIDSSLSQASQPWYRFHGCE